MNKPKNILDSYPGAKGNSGIQQFLINQIPYHTRYFELFAGSAQLFKAKKRAEFNLLADVNREVVLELKDRYFDKGKVSVYWIDALQILEKPSFESVEFSSTDFIYLYPPYPASSRKKKTAIYKNEMLSEDDHLQLLTAVLQSRANVMISTRENDLYTDMLGQWRMESFETRDRRHNCTELIYMNYPTPGVLHQYDQLGDDYIERQALKRKREGFAAKLKRMDPHQVHVLMQELIKHDPTTVKHFLEHR